jgi:hypothetical protein
VYLSVAEHDGFFSDNFFNLAPGREITVEFHSREPLSIEQFKERLQIRLIFLTRYFDAKKFYATHTFFLPPLLT